MTDVRRCSSRGGFVLPVALVVLVLMALISAAGLYSARSHFRSAEATRLAAVALAVADAGANRTVAAWSTLVPALPAPGDSLVLPWQTLPDGSLYRSVIHRAPVGVAETPSPLVLLRTTGRVAPPKVAQRLVATWVVPGVGAPPSLCCRASFLVQARLRVDGAVRNDPVPEIDGTDRSPPGWGSSVCAPPTAGVPGVTSSDLGQVEIRRDGNVAGAPPLRGDTSVTNSSFTAFGAMTYADLTARADIRFTGDTRLRDLGPVVSGGTCDLSVNTNWGSPEAPTGPCGAYFPTVHVSGDLQLQRRGTGQGLLLVDGDLDVDDDMRFYGLIIVQGRMRLRGDARVFGAVLVRGGPAGTSRSEVDDRAKLMYSSCAVQRAQSKFSTGGSTAASSRFWFEVTG